MLVLHIIVAITGLLASALQIFKPQQLLHKLAVGSLIATGATGTLLVWQHPQQLTHACITGIVYVAAFGALSYLAARSRKTA